MRVFLLNPNWNLHNNVYTATITQPVFPLEFAYSASILREKNEVRIYDAHLYNASHTDILREIDNFRAEVVVLETAPTYLFWRCCPLDIDLPQKLSKLIKAKTDALVILIGPHPTVSPEWVMKEISADYLIRGEPEISLASFITSNFDKSM